MCPRGSDWAVKGFIDYYKNIYTISGDTKVVSKIIELMIFPKMLEFASVNNLKLELAPYQNYYPDLTFIDSDGNKYAVDLKSTYRTTNDEVNGMTLGAFTGYFRNRDTTKNILYPYSDYKKHYVFGIIYSRTVVDEVELYLESKLKITLNKTQRKQLIVYINDNVDDVWKIVLEKFKKFKLDNNDREHIDSLTIDELKSYTLDDFHEIKSVVRKFQFFIQEKWKIAKDVPGSGNTKNIGSTAKISELMNGKGLFFREYGSKGLAVFDVYWTNYYNKDMANKAGFKTRPYTDLKTFKAWKEQFQEL